MPSLEVEIKAKAIEKEWEKGENNKLKKWKRRRREGWKQRRKRRGKNIAKQADTQRGRQEEPLGK